MGTHAAQVNFEMVKLAEENVLRVQQGQNPIPLDNVTKLNLFFQMTQAEERDLTRPALTPRTLHRGTFNFPEGFDENRDMGEEGEESFDRGEGGIMEDTPPVNDDTEGEHEGVSAQVLFTTQGMETKADDTPVEDNPTELTQPEGDINQGIEAYDTPTQDNLTDHTEPEGDINQGMEADDTPIQDNPTDHTEPKGDINQGMEADDSPTQDNPTDHTEPKGDINQGMEANDNPVPDNPTDQGMETDTDENAVQSMEGNDTDNTIDYICGVELEIETEYESGRHICLRGDLTLVFKVFFQVRK